MGYEAGAAKAWKYLCEGGAFVEESRGAWLESYRERAVAVCTEALQTNFWREDLWGGEEGGLSLSPFLGPQVQVWSGSLGRPRGCLGCPHLSPALSVALSPDGDQVAVGYRADGIRIYRISSGTEGRRAGVFEPGKNPRTSVPALLWPPVQAAYSLVSYSLASQGAQGQALDVAVSALTWLSSKVLLSGAEDGALQGWLLQGGSLQSLWLLSRHRKPVLGLATSQELLAVASGTVGRLVSHCSF